MRVRRTEHSLTVLQLFRIVGRRKKVGQGLWMQSDVEGLMGFFVAER
jgi:hypothetical protein